jgi:hypothetical protein
MEGRQTVRARAKNAFFPNWKLFASRPGFPDGYYLGAPEVFDMIGYFPNKSTSKICRKHGDPSVLLDLRVWLCTALRHSGSVSEPESSFFSKTSGPRLSTG